MNVTLAKQVRYGFDDKQHLHYLLVDGIRKPLIGTTTALSIMEKGGLTWWASSLACAEFGRLDPNKNKTEVCLKQAESMLEKIKGMSSVQYMSLLEQAYRAHNTRKEKAADEGIDLHSMIETFIKQEIADPNGKQTIPDQIIPFVAWSEQNVKKFLFSELHCYSDVLFCGGIADFGYIDMKDNFVLGDIKSSAEAYFSQWVQEGGYHIQLEENGGFTADGDKIFVCPSPIKYHAIFALRKGLDKPFFNYRTDRTRRAFSYAISLYREKLFFESEV